MKVGDKKKAVILGAVAVVVVGVAVVRVLPQGGGGSAGGAIAEDAAAGTNADASTGFQPDGLVTAPFSHPLLAKRESPQNQDPQGGPAVTGGGDDAPHGVGGGYLPGPLVFLPEGEEESGQESEQAPRAEVLLRLQAVVHAGRPVAILEVGGRTIRVGEGASPMQGWKVIKVSSSSVTLKGTDGERTLRVGESVSVSAPPTTAQQKEG